MEIDQTKSYGVKVSILSAMDSIDFENICEAIRELGYDITLTDNGNAICEKRKDHE